MSETVIELNDKAIRVGDSSGLLLTSPGFALADDNELHLGESAEQQARLKPTKSYNKYWQELNLDPIDHGNDFRHYADIAFAHLQHLGEEADIGGDVILAVPGSFTRQQLSILLGLTSHCDFNVAGIVDSAVAAAVASARARNIIYADLQLHQVVLTRLNIDDQQVHGGSTVQIPGVGSQNFMDLMMQLATGMFIQQCRFNPQHNAGSEQELYNELPGWLVQAKEGNLILELQAGSTVHTAKMPYDALVSSLQGHFRKISDQIAALATEADTQLIVSANLASLPGFHASIPPTMDLLVLEPHVVNDACLEYRDLITTNPDGIQWVKSLPASDDSKLDVSRSRTGENLPTHILFRNRAVPLGNMTIENRESVNGNALTSSVLTLSINGLPASLGRIEKRKDGVYFDSGEVEFLLNQQNEVGERKLAIGDHLQFAGGEDQLTLIQVRDV